MSAELVFVDTNVLLYAHDSLAGDKGRIARSRLADLWATDTGVLSIQVLQEFFVNATRKLAQPLTLHLAREVVALYRPWVRNDPSVDVVLRAIDLSALATVSLWDGLILAAAEQAGAGVLLSEDLTHGQVIAGVRIEDPFSASGPAKPIA